jgi:N-acetylmuramoyl-L-alanine amidase
MKLRKLVLCMLVGIFAFNFTIMNAYAAEDENSNQVQVNIIEEATTDHTDINPVIEETNQVDVNTNQVEEKTIQVAEEADQLKEESTKSQNDTNKSKVESKAKAETSNTKNKTSKAKVEVKKYTDSELRLLSAIIFCEAGGESYNGKLAVGIVVMNRKRSNLYPNTVKDVIYQKYQFSPVRNGSLKRALAEYDNGKFTSQNEKECIKAAKAALSGEKYITVSGAKKNFSKYLSFSGRLRGYTFKLGNHKFK